MEEIRARVLASQSPDGGGAGGGEVSAEALEIVINNDAELWGVPALRSTSSAARTPMVSAWALGPWTGLEGSPTLGYAGGEFPRTKESQDPRESVWSLGSGVH